MLKRKPVATIRDIEVADAVNTEPEPAPARSIRQYDITSASAWTRRFKSKEQVSRNVVYTLTFATSIPGWGMVLTTGEPKNPNALVVAAAKISLWRTVTQVVLGDPTSERDTRQPIELKLDSKWKHNKYAVSLPLPPTATGESRVLEMQWKGTNEVKGFMKKMDRGMHRKLVEISTNRLLARYVHNPWSMDIADTVEICADIPGIEAQVWDLFLLVSALAIAEKTLKIVKMSMHADDDPSGLVEGVSAGVGAVSSR